MPKDHIDLSTTHEFETEPNSICPVKTICYRCGWAHLANSCGSCKSHQEHNAPQDMTTQLVRTFSTPINIAPSRSLCPALTIGQGTMLDIPSTVDVHVKLGHNGLGPVRPLSQGMYAIPGEAINPANGLNTEELRLQYPRGQPLVEVISPRKNWSDLKHTSRHVIDLYSDSSESNCEKLSSSNSKTVEDEEIDSLYQYRTNSSSVNMVSRTGCRALKVDDSEEDF